MLKQYSFYKWFSSFIFYKEFSFFYFLRIKKTKKSSKKIKQPVVKPCFVRLEQQNYDHYMTQESPVRPKKKRRAISPKYIDDTSSEDEPIYDYEEINDNCDYINTENSTSDGCCSKESKCSYSCLNLVSSQCEVLKNLFITLLYDLKKQSTVDEVPDANIESEIDWNNIIYETVVGKRRDCNKMVYTKHEKKHLWQKSRTKKWGSGVFMPNRDFT